ncbi:aldehyde reductase [Apiospora phragmitis]|uniref:Aldehyde reductase n=1 Tax=Apiospora phragmitis TaxID=2905665 RepID=A0ABR1VVT0_9PEZI
MADPTTIPRDSLILVTAANGLIASHVADQLLAAGYRVRGTVRNVERCAWMASLFGRVYGPDRLGRGHARRHGGRARAGARRPERAGLRGRVRRGVAGARRGAGRGEAGFFFFGGGQQLRGFVFTSSAWAAYTPDAAIKQTLTQKSWNETALSLAKPSNGIVTFDPSHAEPKYMLAPFMALKTRIERAYWAWVEKEQPNFTCNTVLLDTVMGRCLDPRGPQGVPSTAGMVRWVWDGTGRQVLDAMQPQWHIDTGDAGRLYVAALTQQGVGRERIFGFGERFSWFQVRRLMLEWYGDDRKKDIVPVADVGVDQTEVPNERGAELLRRLGRPGWTGLEESLRANMESIFEAEGASSG